MKRTNIRCWSRAWSRIRVHSLPIVAVTFAYAQNMSALVPVRFGSPTYFETDGHPVAVASGDLNQDGKLDIATVNPASNSVSVLFGIGNGSLGGRSDFQVAYYPTALTFGNLNNDTHLDIVVLGRTNLTVLLGSGAGGFSVTNLPTDLNLPEDLSGDAVCIGDFNKDGRNDVASSAGKVAFGRGDGSFFTPRSYDIGGDRFCVTAGDMNLDGSLDLIFPGSILFNNGFGTFGNLNSYGPFAQWPYSLVLVDLNSDGRLDVAATSGTTVISRTNTVGGGFGTTNRLLLQDPAVALDWSDFNCDGKPDLVVVGGRSYVGSRYGIFLRPFLGNGDGSFMAGSTNTLPGTLYAWPRAVAAGDLNSDGKPDVVFVSTNSVGVLLNTTTPQLDITPAQGYVQITWSSILGAGFALESAASLSSTNVWQPFPYPPVTIGNQKAVADWVTGARGFYRLRKQ